MADVQIPAKFDYLFDPPLGSVRYRGSYGGRGSGKSHTKATALLVHGAARPLRILCAREYQASIRDSVHKLLADKIEALGMQGLYRVQERGIFGTNGTEFLFKGLRKNIAEVKSTEGIDIAWVEEAQAVSKVSWETLIPTVRKEGSEIWLSFNPDQASDETYQRFVVNPPARSIIRKIGFEDNPFCPGVLIEEARELQAKELVAGVLDLGDAVEVLDPRGPLRGGGIRPDAGRGLG